VDFGDLNACLKRCDSDNDCRTRDGYECREDVGDVPFCYAPVSEDMSVPPAADAGSSDARTGSDVLQVDGSGDAESDSGTTPDALEEDAPGASTDGSGSAPADGSAQAETDGSAEGSAP
jgi:hypothetical protein